jgi:malate dehydrogenase
VMYSFPVTIKNGRANVVEGLEISRDVRERMKVTETELIEEREAVSSLF